MFPILMPSQTSAGLMEEVDCEGSEYVSTIISLLREMRLHLSDCLYQSESVGGRFYGKEMNWITLVCTWKYFTPQINFIIPLFLYRNNGFILIQVGEGNSAYFAWEQLYFDAKALKCFTQRRVSILITLRNSVISIDRVFPLKRLLNLKVAMPT